MYLEKSALSVILLRANEINKSLTDVGKGSKEILASQKGFNIQPYPRVEADRGEGGGILKTGEACAPRR